MTNRVLILGATGYVGSRLLTRLKETSDVDAVGAGRRHPNVPAGAAFQLFDATDKLALARELVNFDTVINCVSGSARTIAEGAQALHDAVIATKEKRAIRVVHMSSMAVYGDVQEEVAENHPMALSLASNPHESYAGAKIYAEQLLGNLDDVVIFRPGCIYGPDSPQWTVRMVRLLKAGRIGDLGAGGDGCSNLVYVDDVVEAMVATLTTRTATKGIFNLAMPAAPTWNIYFESLARHIGAVPLKRIGARQLKIEAFLLAPLIRGVETVGRKAGQKWDDRIPAIPPSLLRLWRQDIRLNSAQASRLLLPHWTPLKEGIRQSTQGKT